jgi:selenide, water dikinase
VLSVAARGIVPSGTYSNHAFVGEEVDWGELPEPEQLVLADAQTSGGMLIAIGEEGVERLRTALVSRGIPAAEIGVVEGGPPGRISVSGRVS